MIVDIAKAVGFIEPQMKSTKVKKNSYGVKSRRKVTTGTKIDLDMVDSKFENLLNEKIAKLYN